MLLAQLEEIQSLQKMVTELVQSPDLKQSLLKLVFSPGLCSSCFDQIYEMLNNEHEEVIKDRKTYEEAYDKMKSDFHKHMTQSVANQMEHKEQESQEKEKRRESELREKLSKLQARREYLLELRKQRNDDLEKVQKKENEYWSDYNDFDEKKYSSHVRRVRVAEQTELFQRAYMQLKSSTLLFDINVANASINHFKVIKNDHVCRNLCIVH